MKYQTNSILKGKIVYRNGNNYLRILINVRISNRKYINIYFRNKHIDSIIQVLHYI